MNRLSVRSSGMRVILALSTGLLFIALSSPAEAAPTVSLKQAVHFAASDGSDVVAEAGTYQVDVSDSQLSLTAEGRAPLLLEAKPTTHSENIDSPLAVMVPGDDPDLLHVVLLQPNGQALDAPGSLSGTRSRDIAMMLATSSQIQFAVMQAAPPMPPPVPPVINPSRVLQGQAAPPLSTLQQFSVQPQPLTFAVVSYGGKCLDFGAPPQVGGAPVFIYTCNGTIAQQVVVQEINDRHEVIMRAGTQVIGVRGFSEAMRPSVLSRGVGATSEALLELQNEKDRLNQGQTVLASAAGQIFTLDGDSIILAADRTKVVKVQGNRGRDRTPLVLGRRDLADNEFWTFVATDKSNRKPTSGFVRVPQEKDFARAVNDARWGTVIDVDPGVSIALNPPLPLYVPEGVTIRGDRRGMRFGPELSAPKGFDGTMLDIRFSDVRVTGLRLRGPSRSTVDEASNKDARAIDVLDSANRVLIDHNDISDWPAQGVRVDGADEPAVCSDHRDPRGYRPNNVRVALNFIHHNQKQNRGYGVQAHTNSFPLIDGNTFVSNRHAIEASGTGCTNYLAWNNLVLSTAPLQDRTGPFNGYTHDFDVHGTERLKLDIIVDIDLTGGFGGNAGQYFEIARNTFLGTNRQNFDLRGEPSYLVEIHHNVSLKSFGDAIGCSYCEGGVNKLKVSDTNQFSVLPNPTTRLGVGDFDGDGRDDLFLATGAAWYYAPAGNAEWRFLNAQTDGIGTLLFGDFDADGRTDVFTQRGGAWLVSWAGASQWERINGSDQALSEFRIGDFVGDRRADVFYADGQRWYVSDGGVGPFVNTQDSSKRVADLGFGDFNGDGKTDVVGVTSGQWMVSLSATGPWTGWPLRAALTKTMAGMIIADFNGNGHADIVSITPTVVPAIPRVVGSETTLRWNIKVSWDGKSDWKPLSSIPDSLPGSLPAIGRFDSTGGADIVSFWFKENHLGIKSSGVGAPVRHSRQDMR